MILLKATRKKYSDGILNSQNRIMTHLIIIFPKYHKPTKFSVTPSRELSTTSTVRKSSERDSLLRANLKEDIGLQIIQIKYFKSSSNPTTLFLNSSTSKFHKRDHFLAMLSVLLTTNKIISVMTLLLLYSVHLTNFILELPKE